MMRYIFISGLLFIYSLMHGASTFSPEQNFDWLGWVNVYELGPNESAGSYIEGQALAIENVPAEFNQLGLLSIKPNVSLGDDALTSDSNIRTTWTRDSDGNNIPDKGNKYIESYLLFTPFGNETQGSTASNIIFSNAMGGGTYSENVYNRPSAAESWAYFENGDDSLYPFSFPNGGVITFDAYASNTSAEIHFTFEKAVWPDNVPNYVTETILIAPTTLQSYSIEIPPLDPNYLFSHFLLNLLTSDVDLHLFNVSVQAYAGESVPRGETLTFNGYCLENPLDSDRFSASAFIKIFDQSNSEISLLSYEKTPLISNSNYAVSSNIPDQDGLYVQIGFIIEGPNTLSSEAIPPIILHTSDTSTLSGTRSLTNPYLESNGLITIEAEDYHHKGSNSSDQWTLYSEGTGDGAAFTGSNGSFLQVVPDDGTQTNWNEGAYVDYLIYVPESARYQFRAKWSGHNTSSDSIFYSVREIDELIWSNSFSRWYQDSSNSTSNFGDYDGFGEAEVNAATVAQNQIHFDFPESGYYTLRISAREDGAAIDSMQLERTNYNEVNEGTPIANNDSYTVRKSGSSKLNILNNDTGNYLLNSLQVTSSPVNGTISINYDGSLNYQHNGGDETSDSFQYQIADASNNTSTGTVTLTISNELRIETNYVQMPDAPPETSSDLTFYDAFPGITFNVANGFNSIPNVEDKLLVVEGTGKVYLVDKINIDPEKIEILDISDRIFEEGERAMKSIAAHPNWLDNGYVFVTYNFVDDWSTFANTSGSYNNSYRISRFTMSRSYPYSIDVNSEKVLIQQELEGKWHSVSSLQFGPDGYLYYGSGDDEDDAQKDSFSNSQYIDKNYLSGLFRIDVDLEPGDLGTGSLDDDNVFPNSHPSVVLHNGIPGYEVPADNPFIGATSFNNINVNPNNVIKEFFIVGLRNPWQFSLEDYNNDGVLDEVWIGDVGYDASGEIGRYTAGANGGWAWHHGFNKNFNYNGNSNFNGASKANANISDPVWDVLYPWNTANGEGNTYGGNSVTGGFIYNGELSKLDGKYVFGDFVTSHIWVLDPNISNPTPGNGIERVGGVSSVVQFLEDPASDDVLILDRSSGIKRVTAQPVIDSNFPQTLSETNFFEDLSLMSPNPGGIYYNVNLRFWSDYAEKYRWFLINDPNQTLGFKLNGPWTYPDGMVFVKHFEYPTQWESFTRTFNGQTITDRRPLENSPQRKIETRFLVHTTDGEAYGVSYRWENTNSGTQTEANLAPSNGANFDIDITLDGEVISVPWTIPTRNGCITCHNEQAGYSLSFNTRQLNTSGSIDGNSDNFIQLLHEYGYLSDFDPQLHQNLPRHTRPNEEDYSLEHRARSYIDVNCAYCHQEDGTGNITGAIWDGRAHLNLDATNIVNGNVYRGTASPDHKMLVTGTADNSVLYNRMSGATYYAQMPPLAKNTVDHEGSELLAKWINNEVKPYTSYAEWKEYYFGTSADESLTNPEVDADNDGYNNYWEWITHTDGNDASDFWSPSLSVNAENVSLNLKGLSNRTIRVLHTPNLNSEWSEWEDYPYENIPLNPEFDYSLLDSLDASGFFKFEIIE